MLGEMSQYWGSKEALLSSSLDNWTVVIPVSGTRMSKSTLQLSRKPQCPPNHTPLSKREIGPCVINFSKEPEPLQRTFKARYRHQQMNHIFQTTLSLSQQFQRKPCGRSNVTGKFQDRSIIQSIAKRKQK